MSSLFSWSLSLSTISEIAAWCDFEESDDLAELLTLLGAKPTTKTRIFSAIPQKLLESTIQKWRLPSGGSQPSLTGQSGDVGGSGATHARQAR